MSDHFFPSFNKDELQQILASDDLALYESVVHPLQEELYRRQDFDFLDDLTKGQQLLLCYDYVRDQVGQGGFIQLLANGYIGLLPDMPDCLELVGAEKMAQLIDDVIKVYVLNIDFFRKEMTTQEFARLYDELKEFETLETRFHEINQETIAIMMNYVRSHTNEFIQTR